MTLSRFTHVPAIIYVPDDCLMDDSSRISICSLEESMNMRSSDPATPSMRRWATSSSSESSWKPPCLPKRKSTFYGNDSDDEDTEVKSSDEPPRMPSRRRGVAPPRRTLSDLPTSRALSVRTLSGPSISKSKGSTDSLAPRRPRRSISRRNLMTMVDESTSPNHRTTFEKPSRNRVGCSAA